MPTNQTDRPTGRRLTEEDGGDVLASLLRDALEGARSPGSMIEATASAGYSTTVDGSFDLAVAAHHFVEAVRAAGLL